MTMPNKVIKVKGVDEPVGTGWLPPVPDLRDYTGDHEKIKPIRQKLKMRSGAKNLPEKIDLREWCSPVENQLNLGSCTAQAATGIIEYFEKRAFGKHIEASRLFLYKTTRNLMKQKGDTGAWIRNVMGALVLCGLPDEKYWPYKVEDFDKEPGSFIYSIADEYRTLKYFCHDPSGKEIPGQDVIGSVKKYLEAGIPSMFGFWGFPSFNDCDIPGGIPYPGSNEQAEWGHAIATVGYDDKRIITNTSNNVETKGALLIRNSWGKEWGEEGYGWLPYRYVTDGLATDFWSVLDMGWIDTGQFGV